MKNVDFHKFNFGTVKWTDMFDNEAELIHCVKIIDVAKYLKICKGYQMIDGFQRTLRAGRELSKPQLTQLKRLAKEVYRYHNAI